MTVEGSAALSFWHDSAAPPGPRRGALPGDREADVVIVGAGYTGLWTAHSLLRLDPSLRVIVLEREVAGFGASGRNGGWCSAIMPTSLDAFARSHGRDAAMRMQRAMIDAVDEVGRSAAAEGIDCHFAKGGWVQLARNPPQAERARATVAELERFGFGADDMRWLERADAQAHVGATGVLGASFTPHCAALHPARLAHGLAAAVEARGATIHEGTAVERIESGRVQTAHGSVRAEVVVRATEGYTPGIHGLRRDLIPIYSLIVATAPLDAGVWEAIGLRRREVFNDARWQVIYGQRSADDRLVFGGRGAPYHYASAVKPAFDRDDRVRRLLAGTIATLFPTLDGVELSHHWGGPLGVPRDWHASVCFDPATGLAAAGGYVGDGVSTANLAGRTLADLILRRSSELTTLPWVGHRSPRWEPEPLRWLAVNAAVGLARGIDRHEARTARPARLRSAVLRRLTAH